MPLIKTAANNLIGGVSQQPPAVRRPDQVEKMVNAWPSGVDGAAKRQPTAHRALLAGSVPAVAKYHDVYRDSAEQYELIIEPTGITVWDKVANVSRTVINDAGDWSYLTGFTSEDDIEALSVADYTFVVNRGTTVAMDVATTSTSPTGATGDEAFIFVRQGNYKTSYGVKMRVAGVDYNAIPTTDTWDGNTAVGVEISSIKTEDIAAQLVTDITAATIPGLNISQEGSVIRLWSMSPTVINNIETTDSVGDTVLAVVHNEVPRVEGYLPELCYHGFKVKVVGDAEIDGDNYWVEFVAEDGTNRPFAKGYWREAVAPGVEFQFDATTMPHQLTRQWNGGVPEFHWDVADWGDRTVGDDTSIPDPSFVGKTIESLFFYKDRLGFLADETINLTETGEYFNFFRTTLLTLRDTAPIDYTLNHTRVALLRNATPHNEDMIISSDRSQFVLRGGDILSPRTVEVIPVAEYENTFKTPPLSTGRSIFIPFKRGSQSGVRELFQVGDVARFDAFDTTAQVPNYIEGEARQLAGSTLEETLILLSDASATTNKLWVYKYIWSGQEKIQSAWFEWDVGAGADVKHVSFVNNTLWLIVARNSELFLEKLELASGLRDAQQTYVTHLDRRFDEGDALAVSYDAGPGETSITPPYTPEAGAEYEVVEKDTGIRYKVTVVAGDFVIKGDLSTSSVPFFAGQKYTMRLALTPPIVKQQVQGGVIGEHEVVQKALKGLVQYSASRVFHVDCRVGVRNKYRYTFNGLSPDISPFNQTLSVYISGADLIVVAGEIDVEKFAVDTWFSLQGTASNDGLYQVTAVTAATMQVDGGWAANEGSASAPITDVIISRNPPIGIVDLTTGEFEYPIRGRADKVAIDIINDSPYPSNFTAALWHILYRPRARRLG